MTRPAWKESIANLNFVLDRLRLWFHSCGMTEDELFAEFDRPDVPGVSALIAQEGQIRLARSYGAANLTTNSPVSPDTNFRLASLTKQFTAMSIMILAERGKLALGDALPAFVPGFPRYGDSITLGHLLTHTSGLLDYEDLIPAGTATPLTDRDVLEILRRQDRTFFPAGTSFRYSNGGYAFLALVVEAASGKRFSAFLRENIFEPLAMRNTVAFEAGVSEVPCRAIGYTRRGEVFEETDQSVTSAVLGDGGIYSSITDLFQWDQALYGEKLVSRPMLEQAFADHGSGYGFGWFVDREKVWHHGETCGFTTRIERFPRVRRTVILLANRRDADLATIARKLAPQL
jgi:CubicO group peptidase (beta-lactamase class C family)